MGIEDKGHVYTKLDRTVFQIIMQIVCKCHRDCLFFN